jgi:hypothetical protein
MRYVTIALLDVDELEYDDRAAPEVLEMNPIFVANQEVRLSPAISAVAIVPIQYQFQVENPENNDVHEDEWWLSKKRKE